MLSVSKNLPTDNYSVVVLSDNAGSSFNPRTNGRVRVKIPSHLGMVDFGGSYLQFNAKVNKPAGSTANIPMSWSQNQGATSIVRDLRILVDGREVESIANYNVLDLLDKTFGRDLPLKELNSVLDHSIGNNQFYSGFDSGFTNPVAITYNNISTKQAVRLNCSGLLDLPVGFPVLATGDVEIELTLEDNERALQPVGKTQNVPLQNATADGSGNVADVDLTPNQVNFPLYQGNGWGWDDNTYTTSTNCPFSVGSSLTITGTSSLDGAFTKTGCVVSALSNAGAGNEIRLTLSGMTGFSAGAVLSGLKLTLEVPDFTYELDQVEFVCRAVNMPPPYLNSLQQRIQQEGGVVYDIHSFSSYLDTIDAGIPRQSLNVPCYSSRLKAVFGVPVEASQTNYHFDRKGKVDGLRNFQSQVGDRREPNRPVDLTNWTTSGGSQYASQEYIQELEKSFLASSMGLRTLNDWRDNFVLNRSLSYAGSSEDLNDKMFRFEIEHNSGHTNTAKNVYAFAHHIKRLQITPTGLQVFS